MLTACKQKSTCTASTNVRNMAGMIPALDRIMAAIEFTLDGTIGTANAGEAGRGFAVIAAEMKQPAAQVSSATKTISSEIRGMQSFSGDVVMAPKSIQTAVSGITSSISFVAAAGEQQSAAAQEVSSTTQLAAFSVSAIDKGVGIMATAMSSASQATEQIRGNMQLLENQDRFRQTISAATTVWTHGEHGQDAECEHKRDALNQKLHIGNLDPSR